MTDDFNKEENQQPNQSGREDDQQSGQRQRTDIEDVPQKLPSQGGHDVESDEQDEPDQDRQRRAS